MVLELLNYTFIFFQENNAMLSYRAIHVFNVFFKVDERLIISINIYS